MPKLREFMPDYDPAQVSSTGQEPVPPGEYSAEITMTDVAANKSGEGKHLIVELAILTGPHSGRKVWARLNVDHPNLLAQQIARREFRDLCRACGYPDDKPPEATEELHGKRVRVRVWHDRGPDGQTYTRVGRFARLPAVETPVASAGRYVPPKPDNRIAAGTWSDLVASGPHESIPEQPEYAPEHAGPSGDQVPF